MTTRQLARTAEAVWLQRRYAKHVGYDGGVMDRVLYSVATDSAVLEALADAADRAAVVQWAHPQTSPPDLVAPTALRAPSPAAGHLPAPALPAAAVVALG